MNRTKVPFYFVLYLVVLVELLAVIIERDGTELELQARLNEYATIQDSIISLYSRPILLAVEEETDWLISGRDSAHVLISISNLHTIEEKAGVQYYINPYEEGNYYNVMVDKKTGNGDFYFKTNKNGSYNFDVYCKIIRQLPRYLPDIIIDGISAKVGTGYEAKSDTVIFKIKARRRQQSFDKPGRG
jgi:hypothetical protein